MTELDLAHIDRSGSLGDQLEAIIAALPEDHLTLGQLLQVFGHHPSWHRVDGRFSHCQDQAWTSHRAHTGAGDKAHARLLQQSHAAEE